MFLLDRKTAASGAQYVKILPHFSKNKSIKMNRGKDAFDIVDK